MVDQIMLYGNKFKGSFLLLGSLDGAGSGAFNYFVGGWDGTARSVDTTYGNVPLKC